MKTAGPGIRKLEPRCVMYSRKRNSITSCLCAILVPSHRAKVAAATACVIKLTHQAGLGSNVLHYTTPTVPPSSE